MRPLEPSQESLARLSMSVAVVARDPSFWFGLSNPLLRTHIVSSGVGFEVWRQAGIGADGENLVGLGDGVGSDSERKHSRKSQSPPGWYPQFSTYQYTTCTPDVIRLGSEAGARGVRDRATARVHPVR
ncbi:hypothetical protein GB937_010629 [Aspergillus fischeri]|nr:hypothetical protein GB937_010629 [Aspergillus fischeri]